MDRWRETRAALDQGWYAYGGGRVELSAGLGELGRGVRLFGPEELRGLGFPEGSGDTRIEVVRETTLEAVERLGGGGPVAALNFASARNPGGGVARGAQAQEESLARSSGLYDALIRCPEFYEAHRDDRDLFYSDRVVYTPGVPVFRRDDGSWLPVPLRVAFLTSAAPNRGRSSGSGRARPAGPRVCLRPGPVVCSPSRPITVTPGSCWVRGGAVCSATSLRRLRRRSRCTCAAGSRGVFERVVFAIPDRDDSTRRVFERVLGERR